MAIEPCAPEPQFAPVILAGGSGTRFWPRSRRSRAKQVLALDGERSMIQRTVDRLLPLARAEDFLIVTNELLCATIAEQLPEVPAARILSEPAARNTAPACGLAAYLVAKSNPDTVLGVFPSDHVVSNTERFREIIRAGIALAANSDRIVVLGVPVTRPETGYGYIEKGAAVDTASVPCGDVEVRRVRRFTEKPDRETAEIFVKAGNYAWNGGIFLWTARRLMTALERHSPEMAMLLAKIAEAYGTPAFEQVFAEAYPRCQNISIDYAVLEPLSTMGEAASEIYCLPADFGWNDLGCWSALHEHVANGDAERMSRTNIFDKSENPCVEIDARGNYVYAPGKAVALVGVSNLVVVETADALLITTRESSQDVGKVVAELKHAGHEHLI
ncbi:MAG: sugar phosphate nucleotidyltransferase [Acidobacteriaceae bacterium]|nr:sugar phosphate nucleotidyltransferase [Acidobacteriaceae bacterium]